MTKTALAAAILLAACRDPATQDHTAGSAASPPRPPVQRSAEDPLPEGARMRLGGTRFRHPAPVTDLALSRDQKWLVSASTNAIYAWEVATGRKVYARQLPDLTYVEGLAFAPAGLVVVVTHGPVTIVDPRTWTASEHGTPCERSSVGGFALSPDGATLALACFETNQLVVASLDGRVVATVSGLPEPARVAWSADGGWLAVRCKNEVVLIDAHTHAVSHRFTTSESHVAITFDHGRRLLFADKGRGLPNAVRVVDAQSGDEQPEQPQEMLAKAIAVSPSGTLVALTNAAGNGASVQRPLAVEGSDRGLLRQFLVGAAVFANDHALWLGQGKGVSLWDPQTGGALDGMTGHVDTVTALSYGQNGHTLFSSADDKTTFAWDLANGAATPADPPPKHRKPLVGVPEAAMDAYAWSRDESQFATAVGSEVTFYDANTAERRWQVDLGTRIVGLGITKSGVFAGDERGAIHVVHLDGTHRMMATHPGGLHALAVAPDERSFATGGRDGSILIWTTPAS